MEKILHTALVTENLYEYMKDIMDNKNQKGSISSAAVIVLEQDTPCVLHMEMQVGGSL